MRPDQTLYFTYNLPSGVEVSCKAEFEAGDYSVGIRDAWYVTELTVGNTVTMDREEAERFMGEKEVRKADTIADERAYEIGAPFQVRQVPLRDEL